MKKTSDSVAIPSMVSPNVGLALKFHLIAAALVCFTSVTFAAEPGWWTEQKRACGLPSGLAYNSWNGECRSGTNNSSPPTRDYEAERRQQEAAAAEAAADAERQRLADERRRKEAAERQAAFIRSRDEAVNTLKGSIGNFDGGLKGSNDLGLKGSNDYGLKAADSDQGLKGSSAPSSVQSKQAVAKKKLCPAAPNTNTSVVDARCLPRDGAYLTAQVPELARSPAADRITKGFQAVINHDWPVALAWWQDALNRDPNNAAIKRSVDLAQWMVDRRKAVAAGPPTPLSAAIHAAARGDNTEAIRQFELAKVENPASATHVDSMIATIKEQSAKQAKQAALSAEMMRWQITLVGELNDEGLKMLSVGLDKEAQKLFDDAQFFSMGLSPKQIKSYDSPYFGSVSAVPNRPPPKGKP